MSNCCRWNRIFLWFSAVICLVAPVSTTAKTAPENAGTSSEEARTLTFPKGAGVGRLKLIHKEYSNLDIETLVAAASGQVKVRVPADKWLELELSRPALVHPEQLDACTASGLDALKISFMAMDDSESKFCDNALKHAKQFKSLKCMMLNRSDVTDAGVAAITGLPDLECISLLMTNISGDCFKTFGQYKKLKYLKLTTTPLHEENLKYLAKCPNLTDINVHHTDIGEVGVKYLSQCANLVHVQMADNARVNDACLKYLLNLKHLQTLSLEGTSVSWRGLQALKPLKLTVLSVSTGTCEIKNRSLLQTLATHVVEYSRAHLTKENEGLFAPLH